MVAVITTLFDLIDALYEEVEPGAEDAVTTTVWHLCTSGRLRFLRTPPDDEMVVQAPCSPERKRMSQVSIHDRDGQETSSRNSSVDGDSPTILLIDDDEASCFLLSQALVLRGWEVVTATTVEEAEAVSRRHGPENIGLVITDVHLSNNLDAWEGFEIYTRWTAAHPTLPFLLMSGDSRCKTFAAVRNGSAGFLSKPFAFQHLFETVEAHLRQRS